MTGVRRSLIAPIVVTCLCLACDSFAPAAASAAVCNTNDPPVDTSLATLTWDTDQDVQNNFTQARAAEGCNTPLVLPPGFDGMSPQQQMLWLFNNEREVRGLPDLQLDGTLMSQIALNHSQEEAQYGYFEHPSPVNQGQDVFARDNVNPVLAPATGAGEDIAEGYSLPIAVFAYMYDDADQGWGHREAILGNFNWVGIGVLLNAPGSQAGNYYTDDFANLTNYTPPPTADTNPPVMGQLTYANGTATVTGVADSPMNVNAQGQTPAAAAITSVSFYTNNIVDNGGTFNTVPATQTAPGTWAVQIAVNPGDVLHAVAVDGSGNYADVTMPPPAVALNAGANPIALPAADAGAPVMATDSAAHGGPLQVRAVTPTASALIASVNKQFKRKVAEYVRVYVNNHWQTYRPGKSHDFPLYTGEGVILQMKAKGRWRPTSRQVRYTLPIVSLHKGWNFVAAPYPVSKLTCHAVRLALARGGDRLQQITVGPDRNVGIIMRPKKNGQWGNDHVPIPDGGFWIKDASSTTWVPNPVAIGPRSSRVK